MGLLVQIIAPPAQFVSNQTQAIVIISSPYNISTIPLYYPNLIDVCAVIRTFPIILISTWPHGKFVYLMRSLSRVWLIVAVLCLQKIKQIYGGKENLEVNYLSINCIFIDHEILAYSWAVY